MNMGRLISQYSVFKERKRRRRDKKMRTDPETDVLFPEIFL
jgi:hypothetical protein